MRSADTAAEKRARAESRRRIYLEETGRAPAQRVVTTLGGLILRRLQDTETRAWYLEDPKYHGSHSKSLWRLWGGKNGIPARGADPEKQPPKSEMPLDT